jgi:hypothetical protein
MNELWYMSWKLPLPKFGPNFYRLLMEPQMDFESMFTVLRLILKIDAAEWDSDWGKDIHAIIATFIDSSSNKIKSNIFKY